MKFLIKKIFKVEMPGLMSCRKEFGTTKPLSGGSKKLQFILNKNKKK